MRITTRSNSNNRRQNFKRVGRKSTSTSTYEKSRNRNRNLNSNSDENSQESRSRLDSTTVLYFDAIEQSITLAPSTSTSRLRSTAASQQNQQEQGTTEIGNLHSKNYQIGLKETRSRKVFTKIKNKMRLLNITKTLNENEQEMQLSFTSEDAKPNFWMLQLLSTIKMIPGEFNEKSGFVQLDKNKSRTRQFFDKFLFWFWQCFVMLRILHLVCISIPVAARARSRTQLLSEGQGHSESRSTLEMFRDFGSVSMAAANIGLYYGYMQIIVFNMPSIISVFNSLFKHLRQRQRGPEPEPQPEAEAEWKPQSIPELIEKSKRCPFPFPWKLKVRERAQIPKMVKLLFQRSLRVNLLIYLPFTIYSLMVLLPVTLLLDRDYPIMLTSICHKLVAGSFGISFDLSWMWIFYPLFVLLDLIYYLFMLSLVYIAVLAMLFFLVVTEEQIEEAIHKLSLRGGLEKGRKRLESIKLQIIVFNQVLSTVVYLTKLLSLGAAIIGGFFAIKFLASDPWFITIPACYYFQANLINLVLFDKVCLITGKVEELKDKILEKAQHPKQSVRVGDEYKRFYKSVQRLGIQAGGFYILERENTLIFMDYIINQIVSLLLTFKTRVPRQ